MNVYRMDKTILTIGSAFAAFAVLLVVVGIIIMTSWANFSETCESTTAVIKSIRTSYNSTNSKSHHVEVEYVVDGETYRSYLGYYNSRMRRGQTVTVYYNPEDPYDTMARPYFACGVIVVFVLVFGGLGFGMVFSEFRNKKIINRLAEENKYIVLDSRVERQEVNANVKVNDVHYRKINFIYRDQYGREHIFSSRAYPPGRCPFDPWQNVMVYVDIENDPKKYYVCTDNEYYGENTRSYMNDDLKY